MATPDLRGLSMHAGGGMVPTRGDGMLSTRQAARVAGVAWATFRAWRRLGYVAPDGLDESGYPLYWPSTARRVEAEVRARGIAMTGIDPRRLRRAHHLAA